MSEDQFKDSQENPGYVNIYNEEDAERWSNYFGITKAELKDAVMAAGKSSIAIKKYFERINAAKLEREKRENRDEYNQF